MIELQRLKEGQKRDIVGVVISQWCWDKEFLPVQVELSQDNRQLYLTEEEYVFRTVYGNTAFNEGIHYWEIIADARSEHEIKTGIATKREKN